MDAILRDYCKDKSKKLNKLVDDIVNHDFGGIDGKNMRKYYFIANELISDVGFLSRYDESSGNIECFLYNSLFYAFIYNDYYEDNAKKLNKIVDRVVSQKFGGLQNKDITSFYSIANEVMTDIVLRDRYNKSLGDFDGFLYNSLVYAFIDDDKSNKRFRRCNRKYVTDDDGNKVFDKNGTPQTYVIPDISFDSPISDNEDITYADVIGSDFNLDSEIKELRNCVDNDKYDDYIDSLNRIQKQILFMKMDGIPVAEIKNRLNINNKQYEQHCNIIKSFEKVGILQLHRNIDIKEENEMQENVQMQTLEKSKTDKLQVIAIIKKMDKKTILFNHPLQRESDQWTNEKKGNLISDILQDNPIPPLVFAEQVVNGTAIIWDLDGKQRCTSVHSYYNDGFSISKNVRRWNIEYQTPLLNENGEPMLNGDNIPMYEKKTFDIRGKKFSALPEELRDRFEEYNFDYIQYINCSSEDIAYHVIRYNEGKQMTVSQKGITRLGEEYASLVKAISNMPFFKDIGGYKVSEFKNGVINRVVVESVMAANYLDEWKKKQEDICDYLRVNAKTSDFDNFEDMVSRLEKVVTDEVSNMFDSKDSFLYFSLFAKFIKSETDDSRFIEFMTEFSQSLHSKAIDGISYDDLNENGKSTKDKGTIIAKINLLEKLMNEFLNINKEDIEVNDVLGFVKDVVSDEITQEDIELYEDCLNDYTLNVNNSTKLLERQNFPSLLAIVTYAAVNEEDEYMDEWIQSFFKRNNDYKKNQKQNYELMKQDFEQYIAKHEKMSA